jgi:hypothetical protein
MNTVENYIETVGKLLRDCTDEASREAVLRVAINQIYDERWRQGMSDAADIIKDSDKVKHWFDLSSEDLTKAILHARDQKEGV